MSNHESIKVILLFIAGLLAMLAIGSAVDSVTPVHHQNGEHIGVLHPDYQRPETGPGVKYSHPVHWDSQPLPTDYK